VLVPYADARGARLYYEVHGEGQPLLIHPGFGSTIEVLFANWPVLAERFRVIIFDPRGSGRSDVPASPDGITMATYADDAVAVIDAAGESSAHVFGTSFGGMVAINLALIHPDRVRRLVLACTTPGGAKHVLPRPDQLATFIAASSIADPAAAVRSTFPLHYSDAFIAIEEAAIVGRAITNAHLRSTPEGLAAQVAAVTSHDTYERLPRIAAPALVAHGDDDGIIPVANAQTLAERIPGARLSIYAGARHIFFVECADALNDEITAFLTENER
jgi:pimeloyl-ACP methyl ester carboxylesterase